MKRRSAKLGQALGFHLIWLPPAIVALGAEAHSPWLAFGVLMGLLPFLRIVFGECASRPPNWSEGLASYLERMPAVAAAAYWVALLMVGVCLRSHARRVSDLVGFGAGLWAASLLTSCVAHELLHRAGAGSRLLGRILSGSLGYPFLEHEHVFHHVRTAAAVNDECPRPEESIWAFSLRRLGRVAVAAYEGDRLESMRVGHRLGGGMVASSAALVITAIAFFIIAGTAGGAVYLGSAALTSWAIQATTYLQHWAMGAPGVSSRASGSEFCWEDRCQVQAWITLGICFHQAHHRSPTTPYYRLAPSADAPRQPAGYLILLLIAVFPPLWRVVMRPALRRWMTAPTQSRGAGRALLCFSGKANPRDSSRLT